MDTRALAQRILGKAAARVGSADRLASYLSVTPAKLEAWLEGDEVPPAEMILRAVDLLVDERTAPTS
jgi:DNA-binding transcriptional regulator YdaS (Cro superfamily)